MWKEMSYGFCRFFLSDDSDAHLGSLITVLKHLSALDFRGKTWPLDIKERRIFFYFSSNIPHSHPAQSSSHLIPVQNQWAENVIHSFQDKCCFLLKKRHLTWPTGDDFNSQRLHPRVWVLNHLTWTPIIMIPCPVAVTSSLLGEKVSLIQPACDGLTISFQHTSHPLG